MPAPFEILFGAAFSRGIAASIDPSLVGKNGAVVAENVDLGSGALRGFYSPGEAVETTVPNPAWLAYTPGGWASADRVNFYVEDAPTGGTRIGYRTNLSSSGHTLPSAIVGGTTYRLGLEPPSATAAIADGATGKKRRYAIVFATADGLTSNPTRTGAGPVWLYASKHQGATLSAIPVSADARVTKRLIYATQLDDELGPYYYLDELADNVTTTWTDTGATLSDDLLDWAFQGNVGQPYFKSDHAPAPMLTCLSDGLHSATENTGSTGSGILFGAVDSWVCWSMLGFPQYWPAVNFFKLPAKVAALIGYGATTYAFTEQGSWAFTGLDDSSIRADKTQANHHILYRFRATAVQTPYGVLYVGREGVILHDGNTTQVITKGFISPSEYLGMPAACAAYQDGYYFLSFLAAELVYVVDLNGFPEVRVTKHTGTIPAAFARRLDDGRLYLADANTLDVRPWMPLSKEDLDGAERQAFIYETGAEVAGQPTRLKRFMSYVVDAEGPVTLSFYVAGRQAPVCRKVLAEAKPFQGRRFKLPPGVRGRGLRVRVEGTGASTVYDVRVEGEYL